MKLLITLIVITTFALASPTAYAEDRIPDLSDLCANVFCGSGGIPYEECVLAGSCELPRNCVTNPLSCGLP